MGAKDQIDVSYYKSQYHRGVKESHCKGMCTE